MKSDVVTREFFGVSRTDEFKVYFIGDIHNGNASADRYMPKLKKLIGEEILPNPNAHVVLMGDLNEFINVRDKRWDPESTAEWIGIRDLVDVAGVQIERLNEEVLGPLARADRVLAVVKGNHEDTIEQYTERAVYNGYLTFVKQESGKKEPLGVGMGGWLVLKFYADEKQRSGVAVINVSLHHGFVGGRQSGGKALNMEKWLWNHDCHIAAMGHSHNTDIIGASVEVLTKTGKVEQSPRIGFITGNWLGQAEYAKDKGYYPMPIGYAVAELKPRAKEYMERVRGSIVVG